MRELAHRSENDKKRMSEYFRERFRKTQKLVNPQYPNFAGHKVYLFAVNNDELCRVCTKQAMSLVEDYLEASILIVRSLRDPPDALVCAAMLGGKFICEMQFVMTRGAKGLSVKYKAAASVRRLVPIASEFAGAHE